MQTTFVAATGNAHKLKEFREILSGYRILSCRDLGLSGEVEETGQMFSQNALLKARAAAKALSLPALADDSGLCVDALSGAPGIYSARYAARCGFPSEGDKDARNRSCLLSSLKGIQNRRAHFCCAVALVFPDGKELVSEGKTFGRILEEARGQGGFGYDSLFLSDELNMTFAEADEAQKNAVSHRGRALRALLQMLTREGR